MTTDSLGAFRDSASDFLSRDSTSQRVRALRGTLSGFERGAWRQITELGWTSILIPESYGGLGLTLREVAVIAEEIGQHLLPEPFIAVAVQAATALCRVQDGPLKSSLLKNLAAGELIVGLAWQERIGQVDEEAAATTLTADKDEYVLNGKKMFVTPASGVDGWLVSANAGEVAKLVWLPAGLAGIGLEQVACVDGSVICALTFDKVRIPRTNELTSGGAARSAVQIANDTARIAQGAELLGIVRRTFAITVEHLKTRQQFGKPIGSFQALQHRAVDGYVQLELSAASLSEALDAAEGSSGNFSAAASRVKARCAHAAMMVTRMAIQFHGAMGYTDECDVSLYFKRTLHLSGWLGNAASNRKRYFAWQSRPAVVEAVSTVNEFPRDADWEKMPEAEFREMVRSFFVQKFPQHLRNVPRRVHWHEIKEWYITLSLQGWVAPAWPKKFGGMGLPPDKLLAYIEEQEQYGVARAPDMGVVMIGPLLIQRGSDEQRTKFLPKILSGENVWCQGYSEPGAGSDLASLRTEAIIDGDHFVVTGQKIWTTLAQDATHMFALVRTDKTAKKQAGISFILIDLATPGITIRPIKDIGGDAEFCEVFFDQVRVPCENLVGELNQGWTIAKALLGFERIFLGSPKQSRYALGQLTALADTRKLFDSEAFVARYVELQLDVADLSAAYTYFAEFVKRSEPLPTSVSMLKIWAAETYQRISTMIVEAADDHGGSGLTSDFGNGSINVPALMFSCLAATIYGGSSEIQRNIIAKNVLGLPD